MSTTERGAAGLAKGLELMGRKDRPMACCPQCREPTPLISCMYFRGYEFYCLECGGMFGFLSPRAEDTTPELKALYEQLDVEFQENVGGKLIVEGRTGSDKAQEQHNKALAWMAGRKTR